jgi:sugar phosphate isomerase/epimerase
MQVSQGFMVEHREDYRPAFAAAREAGFDHVELNMEARFSRDAIDASAVRAAAAEHGLDVVVHLPFTVDIGSPFPEARAGACRELEAHIDVAAELDARRAVLHARSFARPFHWDAETVVEAIHGSVRRLQEYGADRGVTVCAENLKGDFVDVTDFPALLSATEASMCLDTGHAYVSGMDGADQAAFLREHGDRIAHVHLNDTRHDGDDEHLPVGLGRVEFAPLAAAMVETDWRGTCTHETLRYGDGFEHVETSKRRFDALLAAAR